MSTYDICVCDMGTCDYMHIHRRVSVADLTGAMRAATARSRRDVESFINKLQPDTETAIRYEELLMCALRKKLVSKEERSFLLLSFLSLSLYGCSCYFFRLYMFASYNTCCYMRVRMSCDN